MEKATGMREQDLKPIVQDVNGFVKEVNPKFLTTLKYKFAKEEYGKVATVPITRREDNNQ